MRWLKLQPTWGSTPIRIDYSNGYDDWFERYGTHIKPEKLPLSQHLIDEIWTWAEIYDTFLDWNDPNNQLQIDPAVEADFWAKGEELLKKIQLELGDEYSIKAGWTTG